MQGGGVLGLETNCPLLLLAYMSMANVTQASENGLLCLLIVELFRFGYAAVRITQAALSDFQGRVTSNSTKEYDCSSICVAALIGSCCAGGTGCWVTWSWIRRVLRPTFT